MKNSTVFFTSLGFKIILDWFLLVLLRINGFSLWRWLVLFYTFLILEIFIVSLSWVCFGLFFLSRLLSKLFLIHPRGDLIRIHIWFITFPKIISLFILLYLQLLWLFLLSIIIFQIDMIFTEMVFPFNKSTTVMVVTCLVSSLSIIDIASIMFFDILKVKLLEIM